MEECLRHAMDLSGLILLHSELAILAKEHGKNNVAF
jgi:coatomer subunit beta'